METFEHSKWKPLSIALAVSSERKIIGLTVASMPCKGSMAAKARAKYGRRRDGRREALLRLLAQARDVASPGCTVLSDENPRYPPLVREVFPQAEHVRVPGLRGCVTGQGELKAARHDPLFALNHSAAMIRDNVKRLARCTWCTTKKARNLADHLAIYAQYHNKVLTA